MSIFITIFIFFFLVSNHDFITHIDFAHISASNTATDDVTHRAFNTNTQYYCGHFSIKTDEKYSLTDGF